MHKIFKCIFFLFICLRGASQTTDGLVLNFNMNGQAKDQTTFGNNGSLINTTSVEGYDGLKNGALKFDGSASLILPNSPTIKPNLPITLSMMVKLENTDEIHPLYYSDIEAFDYTGFFVNAGDGGRIMAHIGGGNGNANVYNRRSYLSSNKLLPNVWHRLTVVINSYDDIAIYIDCEESPGVYSGRGKTKIVYSENTGRIGQGQKTSKYPNSFFLKGAIDDVYLWNKGLTKEEVLDFCAIVDKDSNIAVRNKKIDFKNVQKQDTEEQISKIEFDDTVLEEEIVNTPPPPPPPPPIPESKSIQKNSQELDVTINAELDRKQLKKGQIIKIENLYFDADSTSLNSSSTPALEELANFLLNYPDVIIEIGGHTNGRPPHSFCDSLSTGRAKAVADFLYANNIPQKQVKFKGYGKRKPVASNETTEGRKRNQRVEIKVLNLDF